MTTLVISVSSGVLPCGFDASLPHHLSNNLSITDIVNTFS